MSIKVITDSTSDIPSDLARELDIKVVPTMFVLVTPFTVMALISAEMSFTRS